MAKWYNLPVEIKQTILEHAIDGQPVKFEPRHAATRATRNIKKEEKSKEAESSSADSVISLLVVSKNFVTYNELEGAILTKATICIKDLQAFNALKKRYGTDGLAMMDKIKIDPKMSWWEIVSARTKFPNLHPYLGTKMPNMRRVAVSLCHRFPEHFNCLLTYGQAIKVAKGRPLHYSDLSQLALQWNPFQNTNNIAAMGRKLTQEFLGQLPIIHLQQKQDLWLTRLFDVKDYRRCEVLLEWEVGFTAEDGEDGQIQRVSYCHRYQIVCYTLLTHEQKVQFSSQNWCVILREAEKAFFCPQRLDGHILEGCPWLVKSVNAVKHDKYYTV